MIKVLITGARSYENPVPIERAIARLVSRYGINRLLIITGGAPGVDTLAKHAAVSLGVHCAEIKALWDTHHRAAGPIRNAVMLSLQPDLVLAFHWSLDDSKGTLNCVQAARKAGIPVKVILRPIEVAMPSSVDFEELKNKKRSSKVKVE
jgi:YspA, cpYpsA-related SLOG family